MPEQLPSMMSEIEHVPEKRVRTLTYVDISDAVEQHAIDAAEAKLSASKEELRGFSGFLKKVWKFNLAYDYYRQKEIEKAREGIVRSGNLYVHDTSDLASTKNAKYAILERFSSEFDEVIQTEIGEEKRLVGNSPQERHLKSELKSMLADFVVGRIDEATLEDAKNQLFAREKGLASKDDARVRYADNITEVARELKALGHVEGLRALDHDLELMEGIARTGVRTEAHLTKLDKALGWLKSKPIIGPLISTTGLATAASIAACVVAGVTKKALYATTAGVLGFLGIGVAGGLLSGLGRGRLVEMDRKTHSRQMAQGKTFDAARAQERRKFEAVRYETQNAMHLVNTVTDALYARGSTQRTLKTALSDDEIRTAIGALAELDARDTVGNRKKADLLSYSDITKVEEERTTVLVSKARAKRDLDQLLQTRPHLTGRLSFREYYRHATSTIETALEQGMDERDRAFKSLKRKEQLHAGLAGFATGITIGAALSGVIQEGVALFRSDQQGIAETGVQTLKETITGQAAHAAPAAGPYAPSTPEQPSNFTPLEWLRRFMTDNLPRASGATTDAVPVPGHEGHFFALPKGASITALKDGNFNLFQDGKLLAEHIRFNPDGSITKDSLAELSQRGISVHDATSTIKKPFVETSGVGKGNTLATVEAHKDLFEGIKRVLWFDNDTPGLYDKNELKLWWGGKGGSGIDAQGNYVYNIARMTPDGSYHHNFSVDAQEAMYEGKLRMQLSLSRDTQTFVATVPIDAHGNAVVDPNSDIGKLFFKTHNGHAVFTGKFAEVAEVIGHTKNGADMTRILATHVGTDHAPVVVMKDVPQAVHTFSTPLPYNVELPLPVPIVPRTPLEPAERRELAQRAREYYYGTYHYYGGEHGKDYGILSHSEYQTRMAPALRANPELDLSQDDSRVVSEYLARQSPGYIAELESMIQSQEPMDDETDVVITIPAAFEGENLEKTLRNYARLNDHNRFEIVIFENHSKDKPRDNTPEVINRMKQELPTLKIIHLYKAFDERPPIGELRKYLVDAALLRKQKADIKKSVAIVSNDADLENISSNYANHIAETFQNPHVDALAAKWDYPEHAYKQYPLLHAAQRLWHYFDIAFRHYYLKSPELIGRNSAFRSGIYAAVGGYNPKAQLAEDLEIGWLIKSARRYDVRRVAYSNRAWLETNPRRPVGKMLSGIPLIQQYGDFHENESIRHIPLWELLNEKRDFTDDEFHKEIQAIYNHYARFKGSKGGWIPSNQEYLIDKAFNRAMRFAGIAYEQNNEERLTILNSEELKEKLKQSHRPLKR